MNFSCDTSPERFEKGNHQILKMHDIVDLKTLKVLSMAHNNKLPQKIQNMFEHRESHYCLRGTRMFRT